MRVPQIAAACLLFMAACDHRASTDFLKRPIDERHKNLALESVDRLREFFNRRSCETIYADSSDYFHSQAIQDWLYECDALVGRLGSWSRFDVVSASRCGAPELVVCVLGSAVFEQKVTGLEVALSIDGDQPKLWWISVQDHGNVWVQMPSYKWRPRWWDPPLMPRPDQAREG